LKTCTWASLRFCNISKIKKYKVLGGLIWPRIWSSGGFLKISWLVQRLLNLQEGFRFMSFSIHHTVHDFAYVLGKLGPKSLPSVISNFRREVDEICSLLGCYIANSVNLLPTFRDNILVPSSRVKLKVGPIGCRETSVRLYLYTLHNIPEERRCLYKLDFFSLNYCCLGQVFTGTFCSEKSSFLNHLTLLL
jgi:hypothetical protein